MYLDLLRTEIKNNCKREGNFTLASGKVSNRYYNLKPILLNPLHLSQIGLLMIKPFRYKYEYVAAVGVGGVPLVAACILKGPISSGLIVRKEAKYHGTKQLIEGSFESNRRVLIVEDVITTGHTVEYASEVLQQAGLHIAGITCVLNRSDNTKYTSLLTEKDL